MPRILSCEKFKYICKKANSSALQREINLTPHSFWGSVVRQQSENRISLGQYTFSVHVEHPGILHHSHLCNPTIQCHKYLPIPLDVSSTCLSSQVVTFLTLKMLGYASLSTVLLFLGWSVVLGPSAVNAASLPTVDLGYAIYQAKLADVCNLSAVPHLERKY
jgi:hypothetical protein